MIKKIFFITSCLLFSNIGFTQKKLKDEALVAQEKRQVFERWGDWKPRAKRFLGIQYSVPYAFAWGDLSHKRNMQYRRGKDIRPLKADGEETQRQLNVTLARNEAEKLKISLDSIYNRSLSDFAHWTSITNKADPLYLIYYRKALKPFTDFPAQPQNKQQWGIKEDKVYQTLLKTGMIDDLQRDLDLLHDTYDKAMYSDMPRGKRFLMYHKVLMGWRRFKSKLVGYDRDYTRLVYYERYGTDATDRLFDYNNNRRSDYEIVQQIIDKNLHLIR